MTFASEMILHHQQAAQMSSMAAYQANSSSVKKLAAQLDVVRAAEVKQLSAWLTGWGAKIPEQSHSHEVSLPGVMTEDEWSEVGRAEGLAFDRLWLRMMIRHHQGAITMAKAGERAGQNSAVVALAKKMQVDQTAEVAAMQQLLGRLVVR
ncbi:DUF305 domain-containing protein [Kribbella sp. NPDC026611]|uniref:DUF305 domain-containing protein n=1 Tax=Kribbella sp. NPDC026611 TaxID=3154911 RepID=UPI0033F78E03